MSEQSPRDTQFAGFAKILWGEIEDKGEFNIDMASRDSDDIVRQIIAHRAYDLMRHMMSVIPPLVNANIPNLDAAMQYIPDMTEWPKEQS